MIDANGKMEITNKKKPEPTPSVETGDSSNLPLFGTILMMSLLVTACVAKKRASILG